MFSGCAAVEWSSCSLVLNTGPREALSQGVVSQRNDLVGARMDIAVHVANHMADSGGFSKVAGMHDQHIFVGRAHDVRRFRVVVQQLTGMQDGARWQFEREDDAVGRLDQPADASAIDGAHRQFDNWQTCRRLSLRMEDANWDRFG
jgi:hypothetical protein